jgi:hypothetical protein
MLLYKVTIIVLADEGVPLDVSMYKAIPEYETRRVNMRRQRRH